ncbi:MAG TPA: hypothetical protein VIH06_09660 [Ilumatobacteraceae bacterium]
MKNTKKFVVALAASLLGLVAVPAATGFASGGGSGSGGGGGGGSTPPPTTTATTTTTTAPAPSGGGTVAGPCGKITSISAGSVQLSSSGTSPLQVRGTVFNCSIYLQQDYIVFDEPGNTNANCRASFALFGVLIINSGGSQSWSKSTSISPSGVPSATGCVGTHTVRAILYDRSFGLVQQTAYFTYTVTQ